MKIILIEPKAPGLHIFTRAKLPRLGLILIGTLAKQMGHRVKIFCEELANIDWQEVQSADLVGVSSLTSTAPRALEIVRKIKQIKPDLPLVVGGPHFSFLPEEALTAGADLVVRKEGEITFKELVGWLTKSKDLNELSEINGLSYAIAGKFFHNPDRDLIENLDELLFPDFDLVVNSHKITNTIFQLGRGCPFDCTFCTVTKMFGRKVRTRKDIPVIVDELEKLLKRAKKKYFIIFPKRESIFFYDDNFYMNPPLVKELLREIIRRKLKINFSAQIRIDAAKDEEFLALARQAGMDYCYIGYESVNQQTLNNYNKKVTIADMVRWTKIIRKYGIRIHGMFVLGGEYDTRQDVFNTVRFAIKNHINTVQFLILTPVPGTPLFESLDAQGRIIDRNWAHYDGHSVNYKPRLINERELRCSVLLKAMPNFYSLGRSIPKLFSIVFHLPFVSKFSLREKFESLGIHLYGHNILKKFKRMNLLKR
jgi:radical SAM superfamily enzyme YgiQ (UPF0313 family)